VTAARIMPIPTSAEVEAYAESIGFKVDGGYFCDYWEQRGWFVKPGIPMRSWQATLRNWQRLEKAKGAGAGGFPPKTNPAEERKLEAARRRAEVIVEAAGRIRAMRSWLKSGQACPWASDPQGEIEADVAKIRDHYGPAGVDELRKVVRGLEGKKP
jgi:hypothetical protein